jgi:hypothetical protein
VEHEAMGEEIALAAVGREQQKGKERRAATEKLAK